ncbi:MAG: TonB family protein [Sandaracinaceae bacterium]|nr:TonB family protein [Sandaracinaceae bacterium]MBK7155289.1 TonB family protein [Sandaracinaceae bacterium]MBK8589192.1 TonB family protein [Sandaracinaceae bacterium]MBP7683678.1 TonB family protein [Deltaproteobacteria bacterium]
MSNPTTPTTPPRPRIVAAPPPPVAKSANPFGQAAKTSLPNPFAPSGKARAAEAELDLRGVDPEKLVYGIAASGPPVDANEVESADQALEVMVMWGRSVLHVDHLRPARSFWVGESESKTETVDYLISPEVLGTQRMPIALVSGGATHLVFPEGATGELLRDGERVTIESIMLEPCAELPGARQLVLPAGATVSMHYKGFTFVTKPVRAGKKVAAGLAWDWAPLTYAAGVLAMVGVLLGAMYFSPPSVAGLNNDVLDPNSRLAQFIITPPETEVPVPEETTSDDGSGEESAPAPGEAGEMGDETAERTDNRFEIPGEADPEDVQVSRDTQRELAATAGAIGALAALANSFNMPTSPFGADQAVGSGDVAALGALTGAQAGQNFGLGGLGLSGTGRGGNYGQVAGLIGTGRIGTHGNCRGPRCTGGSGEGTPGGELGPREPGRPEARPLPPTVSTSALSADAIRRVVRRRLGEVRHCYEQGLISQPDISGTVSVRFVIGPTGSVSAATVAGSSLGAARVDSCVASAVRRWTFPAPEGGGMVAVTYPFMLATN